MKDSSEFQAELRPRAHCGVGAVVDLAGRANHQILSDALQALERLDHRGARGAEQNTGDGAGVLLQKPDALFRREMDDLPAIDAYAVAQLFLPADPDRRRALCDRIEATLAARHFINLGWRDVPTCNTGLGQGALATEPCVRQLFLAHADGLTGRALDRRCYVLRLALDKAVADQPGADAFYICSLDRRTLVYKGLLTNPQLRGYYPDLSDRAVVTSLALVHARFSTNTLGSWAGAHPHRVIVHNGEINTYRANFNRLRDREADLDHPDIGAELRELRPLVPSGISDTELLDAAVELLMAGGRSLDHALRMLIPEAWHNDASMEPARRAWYDYHANLIEPWDGPALVVGSDGERVVATLDRNGFRPCRYDLTHDGRLILASEVGVLDQPAANIRDRERLGPGQMLIVDPAAGGLLDAEQTRQRFRSRQYPKWLDDRPRLADLAPPRDSARAPQLPDLESRQRAAGHTWEVLEHLLRPLAEDGKDPVGAMGDDAPPAALSDAPRQVYDYFKQLFAQVSNPPIDYLRERRVTSLESDIGAQRNLLSESRAHCRRIHLDSPLLTDGELAALRGLQARGFPHATLDATFVPEQSLPAALDTLCAEAAAAAAEGASLLVLSDRASSPDRLPIPGLLAVGAVHQHLLTQDLRLRTALIAEVADAVTVHHVCTLFGFGADAVNPYLALASVGALTGEDAAIPRYLHGLEDGLLKVMSKMGISILESYKGAQLFEALGLASEVIERCFTGSISRVGGSGFARLEDSLRTNHAAAWSPPLPDTPRLATGGALYWRRDGEHHDWDPDTLGLLQAAVRTSDGAAYRAFSTRVDRPAGGARNLRSLLAFNPADAIALEQVEPSDAITRRFSSGSMSLGALSVEAHEAIAIGMNRVGGMGHTGEGGEQEERFGTERECGNKQIASGRFGVTAGYLAAAEQIEIKMAQGAKPGEGGQLPGHKVTGLVAELRHMTPGVGLISPPPHHDIYSIEDLAQLIHDLRAANPRAEIQVKLVATPGVGTIAAGVVKAGADAVLIAGDAGGTGAAAKTSIKSAGLPWELGLAEAQQVLVANRLRSRVRLRVDGGLKTGRDVVVAALLGAESYGFGMAAMIAVGCIMLRKCHCNTCSVGIATQDPALRKLFPGQPEHVVNLMRFIAAEVREHLAALGAHSLDQIIGRVDLLHQVATQANNLHGLDLSYVLAPPEGEDDRRCGGLPEQRASDRVDTAFIDRARPALEYGEAVTIHAAIDNRDRSIGTRLSYWLTRYHGSAGLPDATLRLVLDGVAGQSLGAFVNRGIAIEVTGAANDYAGKGLSGGRISLGAPADAGFDPDSSAILGNAALYGATGGEFYARGAAGERFAVRNAGALAVVEGCGDHGCEYMTGGVVLILGLIGRNFAAGMSGGEVFIPVDAHAALEQLNDDFQVEAIADARDRALVARLLHNQQHYTASRLAGELLAQWPTAAKRLCKITPTGYARAVAEQVAAGRDPRVAPPPAAAAQETA